MNFTSDSLQDNNEKNKNKGFNEMKHFSLIKEEAEPTCKLPQKLHSLNKY
jgi:hypothetical protein